MVVSRVQNSFLGQGSLLNASHLTWLFEIRRQCKIEIRNGLLHFFLRAPYFHTEYTSSVRYCLCIPYLQYTAICVFSGAVKKKMSCVIVTMPQWKRKKKKRRQKEEEEREREKSAAAEVVFQSLDDVNRKKKKRKKYREKKAAAKDR